jgi:hypothetical protein
VSALIKKTLMHRDKDSYAIDILMPEKILRKISLSDVIQIVQKGYGEIFGTGPGGSIKKRNIYFKYIFIKENIDKKKYPKKYP